MDQSLIFKNNNKITIGVELELQLINLHSYDLAMEAEDFLRRVHKSSCLGEIKPEITQSMIEINSSVHESYDSLITELQSIRDNLSKEASKTHIGICGGGAHPFQKWKEQRIFKTERFIDVSDQYGYLAKQFTVFGQHIHIGCPNGDDALYLCHAMAYYIPHFIALAAASPFSQGVDTHFDCSRLTIVSAFPLSGTPPWLLAWKEFQVYYQSVFDLGIVKSIKDFYWDVRPKPEYGTVELRICDTPLTIEKAADLAAFAQSLAHWILETRPVLTKEIYLTYLVNRFRASRYGLDASIIDPIKKEPICLKTDIMKICSTINSFNTLYNNGKALANIQKAAALSSNGSDWLRSQYRKLKSLNDVVRAQTELWAGPNL